MIIDCDLPRRQMLQSPEENTSGHTFLNRRKNRVRFKIFYIINHLDRNSDHIVNFMQDTLHITVDLNT